MNNNAIGVFDSGLGGLTCVKELNKLIPNENIIYFGPMGCRTGFYLLTRDLPKKTVMDTLKKVLKDIIDYTGEVFGASEEECGNYRELELESAKKICREYLHTLNNYSGIDADFVYPQ